MLSAEQRSLIILSDTDSRDESSFLHLFIKSARQSKLQLNIHRLPDDILTQDGKLENHLNKVRLQEHVKTAPLKLDVFDASYFKVVSTKKQRNRFKKQLKKLGLEKPDVLVLGRNNVPEGLRPKSLLDMKGESKSNQVLNIWKQIESLSAVGIADMFLPAGSENQALFEGQSPEEGIRISQLTLEYLEAADTKLVKQRNDRLQDGETYDYYTPLKLDPATARSYENSMNRMFANYHAVIEAAEQKLRSKPLERLREQAWDIIPLAARQHVKIPKPTHQLPTGLNMLGYQEAVQLEPLLSGNTSHGKPERLGKLLPDLLSADLQTCKLLSSSPRHELELVDQVLFSASNISVSEIALELEDMGYRSKHRTLSAGLRTGQLLAYFRFELMANRRELRKLRDMLGATVILQLPSPRFGYDIPQSATDLDLEGAFQKNYDISLELYSLLQEKGFQDESRLAVLGGHKSRALVALNMEHLKHIRHNVLTKEPLITELLAQLEYDYPTVVEWARKD